MMKVYQPLCPDITFRLAADLSPDTLEESEESTPSSSSSSSSTVSEDDEVKMKLYDDAQGSNRTIPNNRFASSSTPASSASALACRSAKEIYNQEHVSTGASSPSVGYASRSSTPSGLDHDLEDEDEDVNSLEKCHKELNSNGLPADITAKHAGSSVGGVVIGQERKQNREEDNAADVEKRYTQKDFAGEEENRFSRKDFASKDVQETHAENFETHAPGRKRHADDVVPDPCFVSRQASQFCIDVKALDDDSDDDSVDDVSISQNVPNCPPPPTPISLPVSPAPPPTREAAGRGLSLATEVSAAASSGSSVESNKATRLHLDIQKPVAKYHGPYTLACDVTPSPMNENVTMVNTLAVVSASSATSSSNGGQTSTNSNQNSNQKAPRRPRKLPEIPKKHQGEASASSCMTRSIFDEIQEALIKEVSADSEDFETPSSASDAQQYPFLHKHMGHLFDKKRLLIGYSTLSTSRSRNPSTSSSVASETGPGKPCRSRNVSGSSVTSEVGAAASLEEEVSFAQAQARPPSGLSSASATTVTCCEQRRRKNSDGDGSRRRHTSTSMSTPYYDLEVTHRGMHRFIPRHADEVQIGIGDPIHVIREYDDLWCEGVNLRSGERGIFPAMYANDLKFLEDSDGDEEHWKFTMRFLGAVEVTSSSGDFALCQAINKVAQQGKVKTASLCTLEINQYGIRMIDKSKEGHESQKFTNFFALKNISFCGTHPNNNRYFAFITKHPREIRFACHVFHSDRSTHRARDALGNAFKRFYQEYMAFTHPTEDIWIE